MRPEHRDALGEADLSAAVHHIVPLERSPRIALLVGCVVALFALGGASAVAQAEAPAAAQPPGNLYIPDVSKVIPPADDPETLSNSLQILVLITILTVAPSIVLMTTCFVRIIVVLGLLRRALGTQSLPPNQVITGLALIMTFLVMAPVGTRINEQALQPYMRGEMAQMDALAIAVNELRGFMFDQIEAAGNEDDVYMMVEYANQTSIGQDESLTRGDVPTVALVPAFVLSELKTAFIIGFKIYLPFLVIDMVIATILVSMGMMMLPPVLISLPFKLLLFVLADGWHLVVGSLMASIVT
jgi:flagellar biosynthetic protein FliP